MHPLGCQLCSILCFAPPPMPIFTQFCEWILSPMPIILCVDLTVRIVERHSWQRSDQHAGNQLFAAGQGAGQRDPVGRHCNRGGAGLLLDCSHVLLCPAGAARHQRLGLCRAGRAGGHLCALEVHKGIWLCTCKRTCVAVPEAVICPVLLCKGAGATADVSC